MSQADSYQRFLLREIDALANTYVDGKVLRDFPELQYIICQKSRQGDGHYAIYEVDEDELIVTIHHIFHTKMDVLGRLQKESASEQEE